MSIRYFQFKLAKFIRNLWIILSLFSLFLIPLGANAVNERHYNRVKETGQCKRCDLSGANLSGSVIVEGDLSRARLKSANLRGVYFQDVQFYKADLTAADLSGAYLAAVSYTHLTLPTTPYV